MFDELQDIKRIFKNKKQTQTIVVVIFHNTVFRDNVEKQDSAVKEAKMAAQVRPVRPDSVVNRDHRVLLDLRDHPDLVENLDHREPKETVAKTDNRDKTDRGVKTVSAS